MPTNCTINSCIYVLPNSDLQTSINYTGCLIYAKTMCLHAELKILRKIMIEKITILNWFHVAHLLWLLTCYVFTQGLQTNAELYDYIGEIIHTSFDNILLILLFYMNINNENSAFLSNSFHVVWHSDYKPMLNCITTRVT